MIIHHFLRGFIFIIILIHCHQLRSQADSLETLIPYKEILTWPEEFSVHFRFGSSLISNSFADEVENLNVSRGPAFDLGLSWIHHTKSPFFFRTGLMVMALKSSETMKAFSYTTDSGTQISYEDAEVIKSVTYLSIPALIGLEISRFYIGTGIQGGLMMSGKGYTINKQNYEERRIPEKVYAEFEAGFRVMSGFRFARHFYAEASYYYGLNNICSGRIDTYGQTWKVSQTTLGIRYSFHYHKPYSKIDIFDLENF